MFDRFINEVELLNLFKLLQPVNVITGSNRVMDVWGRLITFGMSCLTHAV